MRVMSTQAVVVQPPKKYAIMDLTQDEVDFIAALLYRTTGEGIQVGRMYEALVAHGAANGKAAYVPADGGHFNVRMEKVMSAS